MSKRQFSFLALAAIVVIVAIAIFAPTRTGHQVLDETAALLPGAEAAINDVTRLEVAGPGDEIVATLERGDSGWTVAELGGYAANWETVRDVLAGLAEAKVIETKTANAEYYDRLGVQDLATEGASGVRLSFSLGNDPVQLILGDTAEGRSGRYARRVDSGPALLIDFDARVPKSTEDWADRQIADVASGEVAEVRIRHADGETVTARKTSADESDFTLLELPEGRELQSAWSVNSLGGALASLRFDGVRPAAELDWAEATQVTVLTFSGLEVRAETVEADEQAWLRLSATAGAADAGAETEVAIGAEAEGEDDAHATEAPGENGDTEAPAEEDASAAAERLNARVAGWAYRIPDYKHQTLVKRLEDLLKQPEEAESEAP